MTTTIHTMKMKTSHVGDNHGALAVATIMAEKLDGARVVEVTEDEVDILHAKLSQRTPDDHFNYVVAMGAQWSDLVKALAPTDAASVFISHQMFKGIEEVAAAASLFALPGHAMDLSLSAHLNALSTIGVPHGLRLMDLESEAARLKSERHLLNAHRVGSLVVLSGDAPDADGKQHYYTPQEAFDLGEYVATAHIKGVIAVTDGPRTAKFDPLTGAETQYHKGDAGMNPVLRAFLNGVRQTAKVVPVAIEEFYFGRPSAYKGLLGLADEKTTVYLPGESTSMITEGTELFQPDQIIVYDAQSMSETHHRHVSNVFKARLCTRRGVTGGLRAPMKGFAKAVRTDDPAAFLSRDAAKIAKAALKLRLR